ncbi:hypothetical protein [Glutamicibacter arilaitensis]|uniref:hypothetical protein n=1 Tax=Glutamicibacter arilaitensis TaxID=256701 RepID=UPI003FD14865
MNTETLMLFGLDLTDHLLETGASEFVELNTEYHAQDIAKALNAVGMLMTQVLSGLTERPINSVVATYAQSILGSAEAIGLEDHTRNILAIIEGTKNPVKVKTVSVPLAMSYELILGTLVGVCSSMEEIEPEEFMDRLRMVSSLEKD